MDELKSSSLDWLLFSGKNPKKILFLFSLLFFFNYNYNILNLYFFSEYKYNCMKLYNRNFRLDERKSFFHFSFLFFLPFIFCFFLNFVRGSRARLAVMKYLAL